MIKGVYSVKTEKNSDKSIYALLYFIEGIPQHTYINKYCINIICIAVPLE